MKLDEIGQTIENEELVGVLDNLKWKAVQTFLLVDQNGMPIEIPLTNQDNQYVKTSEKYVTLTNSHEQNLKELKTDLKMRNFFLKKHLKDNQYLWPLSSDLKTNTSLSVRIPEELFTELYNRKFKQYKLDYYDFRNQIYLKIAQGFERIEYLLTYLTAASPYKWDSDGNERMRPRRSYETRTLLTEKDYKFDLTTLKKTLRSKDAAAKVWIEGQFDKNQGITALTLKNIDLNPGTLGMIEPSILELVNVLVGYFLMGTGIKNEDLISTMQKARQMDLVTAGENPFKRPQYGQEMRNLLEDINQFACKYSYDQHWKSAYLQLKDKLDDVMQTAAALFLRQQGGQTAFEYIKQHFTNNSNNEYESSLSENTLCLLQAAFDQGIDYQVISPEQDIVKINGKYMKDGFQGEKSAQVLSDLWNEKQVAKQLIGDLAVQVPTSWEIKNIDQATRIFTLIKGKAIVIKNALNHTNVQGTLYRMSPTKREFLESVNLMLKETPKVLVEQVVSGSTYQAMLLNGKVVSLIERIPENVVGNGRDSLGKLIEQKQITIGRNEHQVIVGQGLKLDQVVPRGVQYLLRYDSFTGTRFESLDALGDVDASYIEMIEKIAKKLKLADGFIDIIIDNLYQKLIPSHPELMTFLSAHAIANIKKHTDMLLNQHRDVATKIINNLK